MPYVFYGVLLILCVFFLLIHYINIGVRLKN